MCEVRSESGTTTKQSERTWLAVGVIVVVGNEEVARGVEW